MITAGSDGDSSSGQVTLQALQAMEEQGCKRGVQLLRHTERHKVSARFSPGREAPVAAQLQSTVGAQALLTNITAREQSTTLPRTLGCCMLAFVWAAMAIPAQRNCRLKGKPSHNENSIRTCPLKLGAFCLPPLTRLCRARCNMISTATVLGSPCRHVQSYSRRQQLKLQVRWLASSWCVCQMVFCVLPDHC